MCVFFVHTIENEKRTVQQTHISDMPTEMLTSRCEHYRKKASEQQKKNVVCESKRRKMKWNIQKQTKLSSWIYKIVIMSVWLARII